MVPSAIYSTGGFIEIVCSGSVVYSTNVSCFTVFGLTGTSQCLRLNDTSVQYKRDISSKSVISISLYNVVNPLGVMQLPPF